MSELSENVKEFIEIEKKIVELVRAQDKLEERLIDLGRVMTDEEKEELNEIPYPDYD